MSACREIIEWDYGNVGTMWAFMHYKYLLKLRKMTIADMYLCALLLRNAHVCMNGCQTSEYFDIVPPTFEEWTNQGPHARPNS
jgi:hypothetical protein